MHTTRHAASAADAKTVAAMRREIAQHPAIAFTPALRPAFAVMMQQTPAPDGVTFAGGRVGGVPGWWVRPAAATPGAALLYLHGGAYIVGSAAAFAGLVGQVAARARAVAFIPDYRLAPEHPFPAAVDDADAAYAGLAAAGLTRIALAGDSAGGGLALVELLRATSAATTGAVPRPVAAAVMSPWTDLTLSGASISGRAHADPLLGRAALAEAVRQYAGAHDPADPRLSPLLGVRGGLPAALLHVGEDELLLDDSVAYAARSRAAGNVVELHVWERMLHVFPASVGLLAAAGSALERTGAFLRQALESAA
jgi:acetyl esterase/lipase